MAEHERTILCIDDEISILNSLRRLLRRDGYRFLSATSGEEGLKILGENNIQIVVSDQRMPEMSGTEFMAKVKEAYPEVLRIILTGYTEVDSITESVNKGNIYKFFLKPWNDQNLKLEIKQAFEQYELIQANKKLVKKVVEQNEMLSSVNENLEHLIEERTEELALKNQALALSHAILEDAPVSIMGVDQSGTIVLANGMARSMMMNGGVSVGMQFESYFPKEVCDSLENVLEKSESQNIEAELTDGAPAIINMSPLQGNAGSATGVILTMTAI